MTFTQFHLCLHGSLRMQKNKCTWVYSWNAKQHRFQAFSSFKNCKERCITVLIKTHSFQRQHACSESVLCFTCLHQANLTAKIRILGADTIQVLPNFVTKLWPTLGRWGSNKKMWSNLWNLCFPLVPPTELQFSEYGSNLKYPFLLSC